MPQYIIEGDEAEIGVLVIDWEKREFRVHGVAGDTTNSLSALKALSTMQEAEAEGKGAYAFVVWPRNADGLTQLEFRAMMADDFEDLESEIVAYKERPWDREWTDTQTEFNP